LKFFEDKSKKARRKAKENKCKLLKNKIEINYFILRFMYIWISSSLCFILSLIHLIIEYSKYIDIDDYYSLAFKKNSIFLFF